MKDTLDFEEVGEILNVPIKNKDLFLTAFTHRSYLNEHPTYELPSNERLEFLGDAVLQLYPQNTSIPVMKIQKVTLQILEQQ